MSTHSLGWTWKIIRQEVVQEFSDLPALIQQAQNSSHPLASHMNEIEAAMQVAFWFNQCKDMAEAVKLTVASQPACSHYMETIGSYVRLYGGGEDFPVMKVLDGISKLYGSNACIGEEFMDHVTFLDFKDPDTTFVWLRAGCLAANCTSPRSVDSISKFLVKSDLDKLKHAKIRADVKKGEDLCSLAWETLCQGHLQTDKKGITLMGRLLVRVVLVLTNKSGKGREQKVYNNLQEVNDTFVEELSSLQNPNRAPNPAQPAQAVPATTQAGAVVSLKVRDKRSVHVLSLCRLMLGMVVSLCRLLFGHGMFQPLQAHSGHSRLSPLQAQSWTDNFSASAGSCLALHVAKFGKLFWQPSVFASSRLPGHVFFGCEFVGSRTQQVHLTSRWKATSTWQLESSMCTRMTTARSGSLSPLIPEQENLLTSLCLDLLKKQL